MKSSVSIVFLLVSSLAFGQNPTTSDMWKMYQARDYNGVVETSLPVWKMDSTNIELNLLIGSSYSSGRSFTQAIQFLNYCVKNDTSNSWIKARALDDLGTCHYLLQDYDRSKKDLK